VIESPYVRGPRPGGEPGVLCIHGLSANPAEFDILTQYLQGSLEYSVLNGHCADPTDLLQFTRKDWYNTAMQDYLRMREKYEHIVLVGMSTGALIATALAAELSQEDEPLDGLVSICAPVYLRKLSDRIQLPFARPFAKKMVSMDSSHPDRNYTRVPVHAVIELYEGSKHVRQVAHQITVPTLIVANVDDPTVQEPRSSRKLLNLIPGAELLEFSMPYHNLVSPPEDSHGTPSIIADAIHRKWKYIYEKAA
jgi:esterase/lipase